jgi:hypothetical protein
MPKSLATVLEIGTSSPSSYRRHCQVAKFSENKTKGTCILCNKAVGDAFIRQIEKDFTM